ncbi:M48 family metalloprotease [Chitinimonas sp.]|uniref:M48 family metallopeptidase n=1 Tax=Chitinimonas sp. TaxID=1934313 RepID=UPI0035AE2C85
MDQQAYEMLVWSLEGEARDRPALFRAKVVAISAFAYLVLFGLLGALSLGGFWLFSWARDSHSLRVIVALAVLGLALLPVMLLTLRMFLTRIPPPEGRVLTASEAPKLFQFLAKLQKKLKGPPIHRVLISGDFNASISQVPRFGLFGGHRNYLLLGLPFLHAMASREMMAVISHEYGHLAGSHGKLSAMIYRQRLTFGAIHQHASARRDSGDIVNGIFASLLDRFAPIYNAYTFVLSRQNEYEADAAACRVAGPQASAHGLIRSALLADWLSEQFWPRLFAQASQRAQPAFMPYTAMRKVVGATMSEWATKERLQAAWNQDSGLHDTHPCLRERLNAIDQPASLPPAVDGSAGDAMLGELAHSLSREFDERWWQANKADWQEHHRRHQRAHNRIAELAARPVDTLTAGELQEYALLHSEFGSKDAARAALRHLLDRPGERFARPVMLYGQLLLEVDDAQGIDYLMQACQLAPSLWQDCAQIGGSWLFAHKGEQAAEQWFELLHAKFAS